MSIVPVLTTATVTNTGANSATCGGNITSNGGAVITARGICWSKNQNPTISDTHTGDGTGIGSFTSQMSGLEPGATYYIRAYATNDIGTAYGNSVTLSIAASLPVLTTTAATGITFNSASSGGNITDDGGGAIIVRGVCWSMVPNPTIVDPHSTDGTGKGSFISQITGLNPASTYYARAYATNSAGTAYGGQVSFPTPATVTFFNHNRRNRSDPLHGNLRGNISSDGGALVSARGICWSQSLNPSLSDSYTTEGTGSGIFTSQISGLSPGTKYYFRSYATNIIGTSYGENQSATTPPVLPIVITGAMSDILARTASCGGEVTYDGGAPVTARGVCWSTTLTRQLICIRLLMAQE